MKTNTTLITLLSTLACLVFCARAGDPPERMTYQGFLVDGNGDALGNTSPENYDVIFRIWTGQTGGQLKWSEQQTVTVDKGYFSVLLGQGADVDGEDARPDLSTVFVGADAAERYVGITVKDIGPSNSDVDILPRLRLVTSPFSFLAAQARSLVSPNGVNLATSANGTLTVNGTVNATSGVTGLTAAQIPFLDAAKVTSGTLSTSRIPNLGAGKITSGTLSDSRLSSNVALLNRSTPQEFTATIRGHRGAFGTNAGIIEAWHGPNDRFGIGTTTAPATMIYTSGANASSSIRFGQATGANSYNEQMIITHTGNVGIGTTAPGAKLHVADGTHIDKDVSGGPIGGFIVNGPPGGLNLLLDSNEIQVRHNGGASTLFLNSLGGNVIMGDSDSTVSVPGNVGIGTANPTRGKLQIEGVAGPSTLDLYKVLSHTGVTSEQQTNGSVSFSLYANDRIAAFQFYAFSDERIKSNKQRSDGAQDLATLLSIEISDYTFIDTVTKRGGLHKKVIAQQVENVYPLAVMRSTDVVPDIYQKAPIKDGWVTLATDLKKGERVRLIGAKTDDIHDVLEVTPARFRTTLVAEGEEVFVYGREVDDFRSVDYDAISMLNVSATQQIKREKDEEVKALQLENAELRSRLARLEARDKARDAKIAAIEKRLLAAPGLVSFKRNDATE